MGKMEVIFEGEFFVANLFFHLSSVSAETRFIPLDDAVLGFDAIFPERADDI